MNDIKFFNYGSPAVLDDENIFLPIPLDQPCDARISDIPLGFWNKKFNNVVKLT